MREASVLAALYAPESPFRLASPRDWPQLASLLARPGTPAELLTQAGYQPLADALTPAALEWGWHAVSQGQVLTAAHAEFPRGWLTLLGKAAPPALSLTGVVSAGRAVGVVGSRDLTDPQRAWAREVGAWLTAHGWMIVSGGARGTDAEAAAGARSTGPGARVVEILAHGGDGRETPTCLRLLPTGAGFDVAVAHQRNELIHAWSGVSVILASQSGAGGTWTGTVRAMRRWGLQALVYQDGSPGAQGLVEAGGTPWASLAELELRLAAAAPLRTPQLFDLTDDPGGDAPMRVREAPVRWVTSS